MRLSEFWFAMDEEFGERFARVLARDVVLPRLGGRTADEALRAGVAARDVWLALCEEQDVPPERRHGVGTKPPQP